MTKTQERTLTEFEAIGKDLLDIASYARESHAKFEAMRARMEEKRKEDPSRLSVGAPVNPNLFLPEIDYVIARLEAIKQYLSTSIEIKAQPKL